MQHKLIEVFRSEEPSGGVNLDEQAYRSLRGALVQGAFAPGERLSIRKIAEALGTSPMPARTALRRLSTEQALDLLPSGTAIVPRLTRAAFAEVGAVRAELEPLALRMAAPHLSSVDIARLSELLAEQQQARAKVDPRAFLDADRHFLFTIYEASRAPMLLQFIEALWLRRGPLFWEARWTILSRGNGDHAQQPAILEFLKQGAGPAAAAALHTEITSATEFLLEAHEFADDANVRGPAPGRPRGVRTSTGQVEIIDDE